MTVGEVSIHYFAKRSLGRLEKQLYSLIRVTLPFRGDGENNVFPHRGGFLRCQAFWSEFYACKSNLANPFLRVICVPRSPGPLRVGILTVCLTTLPNTKRVISATLLWLSYLNRKRSQSAILGWMHGATQTQLTIVYRRSFIASHSSFFPRIYHLMVAWFMTENTANVLPLSYRPDIVGTSQLVSLLLLVNCDHSSPSRATGLYMRSLARFFFFRLHH